MERSKKNWREILLVGFIIIVIYSPTVWNGFVYDDQVYIMSNPLVHEKLNLHRIFTESYPPGSKDQGLYRPLLTLSYYLDGKLWGFAKPGAWNGFHLTNLFLHALNTCLLLILLMRLGMSLHLRLTASLLFGLHPVLTEAIAWISGRAELLGTTFGLLALLSLLSRYRFMRFIVTSLLWICAMLCKENWIVLPILAVWSSICMPTFHKMNRLKILRWGCISALIAIGFGWTRSQFTGNFHPPISAYESISAFSRITTALQVLWLYIGLWFWPACLSVYHEIILVTHVGYGIFLVATWGFVFWFVWRLRFTFPWITLAVGWFWISMLPASNLIIPIGAVSGERFLYSSTLFFAPAFVVSLNQALSIRFRGSIYKTFAISLAAFVCLLFSIRTWLRLDDWKNDLALWESAIQCYPQSYIAKVQQSIALLKAGRFAEAHVVATEALRQSEQSPQPYHKNFNPRLIQVDAISQSGMRQMVWAKKFATANEAARDLKPQEALSAYRAIIDEYPEQPQTHEAIGDLYVRLNNPIAARQHFEEAIRLGSKTPMLFGKYGQVLSELGNKAEALLMYDRELEAHPQDPLTHYQRGVVLGDLGDYSGALAAFNKASQILPQFAAPHLNSAAILIHLKRYDEARKELAPILSLDPNHPEAHELLQKISAATQSRK